MPTQPAEYVISAPLLNAITQYLADRPFREVAPMLNQIGTCSPHSPTQPPHPREKPVK